MRGYDLTPFLRTAIDFDRNLARGFPAARQALATRPAADAGYPSYNVVKSDDDHYGVSLVVAGFAEDELDVTVDDGVLVITGRKPTEAEGDAGGNGITYLRRGFAPRDFERRFTLGEDIQVTDARLENGVLHVALERQVPEHRKPRRIEIGAAADDRQAA